MRGSIFLSDNASRFEGRKSATMNRVSPIFSPLKMESPKAQDIQQSTYSRSIAGRIVFSESRPTRTEQSPEFSHE
jgi:hypothetical protein